MVLNINWLNSITLKVIAPDAVEDLVFKNAPLLAYWRKNRFEPYEGGVSMDSAFLYRAMIGGAYAVGDSFNINVVQPTAGQTFTPRQYYTGISDYLENLDTNRGKAAIFNNLRIKMQAAVNTLNTIIDIAQWRHGQASGSGVADDRSTQMNGMAEAMNDGVTIGWDGNIYPTYGGQTRNDGNVGEGYNSVPFFCGDSSTGAAGQITYNKLLDTYLRYTKGNRMPKVGVGNKAVFGFILQRIQTQQRFNFEMVTDAVYGAEGIKFMGSTILVDEYAPSLIYGVNDPALGNYLTSTQTISGSPASGSNLPSSGTYVPGEVFAWINPETWKIRVSSRAPFNFGFYPFRPANNNTLITGQLLVRLNLYCNAPWLNGYLFGINS